MMAPLVSKVMGSVKVWLLELILEMLMVPVVAEPKVMPLKPSTK